MKRHYKEKPLKNGTQRLLKVLWEKHGGLAYIGKVLKTDPQNLINWRWRGFVPLEKVGRLARWMGVPKVCLNYEQVCEYEGMLFAWETVVKASCGLNPREIKYVLSGKAPAFKEENL